MRGKKVNESPLNANIVHWSNLWHTFTFFFLQQGDLSKLWTWSTCFWQLHRTTDIPVSEGNWKVLKSLFLVFNILNAVKNYITVSVKEFCHTIFTLCITSCHLCCVVLTKTDNITEFFFYFCTLSKHLSQKTSDCHRLQIFLINKQLST